MEQQRTMQQHMQYMQQQVLREWERRVKDGWYTYFIAGDSALQESWEEGVTSSNRTKTGEEGGQTGDNEEGVQEAGDAGDTVTRDTIDDKQQEETNKQDTDPTWGANTCQELQILKVISFNLGSFIWSSCSGLAVVAKGNHLLLLTIQQQTTLMTLMRLMWGLLTMKPTTKEEWRPGAGASLSKASARRQVWPGTTLAVSSVNTQK